jgi:predicted RNase H-like HicB family nuclease
MSANEVETRYDEHIGMYIAVAPKQNYCTAFGRTPEEALARLELAVSLWFDSEGGLRRRSGSGDPSPRSE